MPVRCFQHFLLLFCPSTAIVVVVFFFVLTTATPNAWAVPFARGANCRGADDCVPLAKCLLSPSTNESLSQTGELDLRKCDVDAYVRLTHSPFLPSSWPALFEGVHTVELNLSKLGVFPWQILANASRPLSVELSGAAAKLRCTCENAWLAEQVTDDRRDALQPIVFGLPQHLDIGPKWTAHCRDAFQGCRAEQHLSQRVRVVAEAASWKHVFRLLRSGGGRSELLLNYTTEMLPDALQWVSGGNKSLRLNDDADDRIRVEESAEGDLVLEVHNIRADLLGVLAVRCWRCVLPTYALVEFRIPSSPRLSALSDALSHIFTLTAYPLTERQMLRICFPPYSAHPTISDSDTSRRSTNRMPSSSSPSSSNSTDTSVNTTAAADCREVEFGANGIAEDEVVISVGNTTVLIKEIAQQRSFFSRQFSIAVRPCSICPFVVPPRPYTVMVCQDAGHSCTNTTDSPPSSQLLPSDSIAQSIAHRSQQSILGERDFLWKVPLILIGALVCLHISLRYRAHGSSVLRKIKLNGQPPSVERRPTIRGSLPSTTGDEHTATATTTSYARMLRRDQSRCTEETEMVASMRSADDYSTITLIPADSVAIQTKIGRGEFGDVFLASWAGLQVAVKRLKRENANEETLGQESRLLAKLDHENVVRFYGVAAEPRHLLLIFELMTLGDLKTYVRRRRPQPSAYDQFPAGLTLLELLRIMHQMSLGLKYLDLMGVVHCDLAARNVLLSGESDQKVCDASKRPPISVKLADFGMSKRLYSHDYYRTRSHGSQLLPIRWLPPEVLNDGRFSVHSDIWSFGVTMWEVMSWGEIPFPELPASDVIHLIIGGNQPARPADCPESVYQIMKQCWRLAPVERGTAIDIAQQLNKLIMDAESGALQFASTSISDIYDSDRNGTPIVTEEDRTNMLQALIGAPDESH